MKNDNFQNLGKSIIDQFWPMQDLEYVSTCPICKSDKAKQIYTEVKDWSFNCAPGDWAYWQCVKCQSLYLNPRPTRESIGRAYSSYYTHNAKKTNENTLIVLRLKLRNECLFHWLGIDNQPRLNFKSRHLFQIFKPFIFYKYPLDEINKYPRGTFLDVGCGNGDLLDSVKSMGFTVTGLEIDPVAVSAAQERGLNVRQGSFDLLSEYQNHFDYIVCSHVLEHVHEPCTLIQLLIMAVKPGGQVFIAWPNPKSVTLKFFGKHWRGLEAPRHICLLSKEGFLDSVQKNSVLGVNFYGSGVTTVGESWMIRHGKIGIGMKIINKVVHLVTSLLQITSHQDFVTVSFKKPINNLGAGKNYK